MQIAKWMANRLWLNLQTPIRECFIYSNLHSSHCNSAWETLEAGQILRPVAAFAELLADSQVYPSTTLATLSGYFPLFFSFFLSYLFFLLLDFAHDRSRSYFCSCYR